MNIKCSCGKQATTFVDTKRVQDDNEGKAEWLERIWYCNICMPTRKEVEHGNS